MSGKPAARMGDPTQCPEKGHGPNAIVNGSPDVLFDGKPAARLGDKTACGSSLAGGVISTVMINGRPAAVTGSTGSHGDVVIGGSGTVIIGSGSGGRGGAVAGSASALAPATEGPSALTRHNVEDSLNEALPFSTEEEEEEDERDLPVEQGITLRIGMFFDGTGNNLVNTSFTAECRRQDLQEFDPETLENIRQLCESHGYQDTNGDGVYDQTPDTSFGNEATNVALLYRLYQDQADTLVEDDAKEVSTKVYFDGIGTSSGSEDSTWGLAAGQGQAGVVARVSESPVLAVKKLRRLMNNNPQLVIERIEFDAFGFSRGAAAARHFVNEVLKRDGGVLAEHLSHDLPSLMPGFNWQTHVSINFIGLFDTVAAIADPLRGDLSVGDDHNPGVNLYLPPGCARKVVHLTAADEHRHNFSLNRVDSAHEEFSLPGVHSNLGGGYPKIVRERVLIGKPRLLRNAYYSLTSVDRLKLERSRQWQARDEEERLMRARGLPGDGELIQENIAVRATPHSPARNARDLLLALGLDRTVRGELSLVALRVMHAKAACNGVPLDVLNDRDPRFSIPFELQALADKIIASAMSGENLSLNNSEKRFLHGKYIHSSANWTSRSGLLVNKPRANNKRATYEDRPQPGYPA